VKAATRFSFSKREGKSTIFVQNICCASEIPPLRAIIEPLKGVTNVTFNITNKLVYVQHDFTQTSASTIVTKLNAGSFGASLKKVAGAKFRACITDVDASRKSTFVVNNICCASEIPPIKVSNRGER